MTYSLGIDVGTTFTAAALWRDGRAETVPLGDRANTVPSVLFLRHDGSWLVGETAERRAVAEPGRVAREFKRRFGDEVPVLLGDRQIEAQALAGQMIAWVVARVAEREGGPPGHVTLTCPANWGEYRRGLMTEAAAAAGLQDVGLVTEPTAAAIYYASQERLETGALVGVYDLGGGTFDAAVLRKTDAGFELVGQPAGVDSLGGIDFDEEVMAHVAEALGPAWEALDLADPAVLSAVAQVRANVVAAKEALSSDLEAGVAVILPGVTREVRLTRAELEERIRGKLELTLDKFQQVIASADVAPGDLHSVLLVGGSSRIPLVSELIAAELGVPVAVDAHPKFAVCLGAAITGATRLDQQPAAARPRPAAPATLPAGAAAADLLAEPPPLEAVVETDLEETRLTEPTDVLLSPAAPEPEATRVLPAGASSREPPPQWRPEPPPAPRPAPRPEPRPRRLLVTAIALAVILGMVGASRLLASGDGDGDDASTVTTRAGGATIPPTTSDPFRVIRVNFQSAEAKVPAGYLRDFGEPFGRRRGANQGRGLSYGWVKPGTHTPTSLISQGRERNAVKDQRQDTLVHMEGFDSGTGRDVPGDWEIALPIGSYVVEVGVGDITANSDNVVNAEGVPVIAGFRGTPDEMFQEGTVQVEITDGRLTLDSKGGQNTKINYVIITEN